MLLVLARSALWFTAAASLVSASLEHWISTFQVFVEPYSQIWHWVSGLLVAGGAIGAREVYKVDKKLNGTWYWVAALTDHSDDIIGASKGEMKITNIHKQKERAKNPGRVINGYTSTAVGQNLTEELRFGATSIAVGRTSKTLFFEWMQAEPNVLTGLTKINYMSQPTVWFRRAPLDLSGRFLLDNTVGSGTIAFYPNSANADAEYAKKVLQIAEQIQRRLK